MAAPRTGAAMPRFTFIIIVAFMAVLLPLFPADLAAATLTVRFTNNGGPLEDPGLGKFYVYEAEDEERDSYLAWGQDGSTVRLPEGSYSIVVLFTNDHIRAERVREEVELSGDLQLDMAFNIPVAQLTLHITSGGQPVTPGSGRYRLYPAGQREKPLASKRPGRSLTIRAGQYDIEVSHHTLQGMQSKWLENYRLDGVQEETVEMGRSNASLRLTILNGGRALEPSAARWLVYRSGERQRALAESRSGESVTLKPGSYDIALIHEDGSGLGPRWLNGVDLYGNVHREVDLAELANFLRVDIRHRGASLPGAWFSVHPAGERGTELASANNGAELQLEPGSYDIGCFFSNGGVRAERWLTGQELTGLSQLEVELEFQPASLRVTPRRERRNRGGTEETNVLLLLDSSAAMGEALGVRSRMELVQRVLPDAVAGIASGRLNVGLRAYGIAPRARRDCGDSTLLAPLGRAERPLIARVIENLRPTGYAPIAYSLRHAGSDLPAGGNNAMVLITGGGEDCGGDVCTAAAEMLRSGNASRLYVVALGNDQSGSRALDCIGELHAVKTGADLKKALSEIFRSALRMDLGVVNLFEAGGGSWIANGALRERIDVTAGSYDVMINTGSKQYSWQGLEISGEMEVEARERPPSTP
jgi:hypothetical protein